MLNYNEIKPRAIIVLDGQPFEVLASHVFRKQQRKPVNQTKLKNLITGKVTEQSFHQSETVEEADIEKETAIYLYNSRGEWWFVDPEDKSKRFKIDEEVLGTQTQYLKENAEVELVKFDDEIIDISIPIKMTFEVTDAPPNVKGNTAQGGNKPVVIETGATITTPMFIETGDMIVVNTQTGEYVERSQN